MLFIVIATISMTLTAEISSRQAFQCLAAYAKTKGITDPAFDTIDYDSSKEECIQLRHRFISDVRKEIRTKINEAEIQPKYSACIYEKLTGSDSFVNSIIKSAALEYSGEKMQIGKLRSTVDTVLDYIKSSVVACKSDADFGEEFDRLFEQVKGTEKNETDLEEEYCVKKYLIKNNLIDTVLYNIDPNPHNINVTGLNCEGMIKKFNDDIYNEIGFAYIESSELYHIEKVECALEKFREADYFDLMMKISILTTVDVTPIQKLDERENYIRILKKISSNIAGC